MSRQTDDGTPFSIDLIDEDRVRRALGLTSNSGTRHQQRPEQARQRHRFAVDGAVPVVMLKRTDNETLGLKERLANVERALENERIAHAKTRRELQEASQASQAMQTRFGHHELSIVETLRTEREARRSAETALVTLREEVQAEVTRSRAQRKASKEASGTETRIAKTNVAEQKIVDAKVRRETKAFKSTRSRLRTAKEPQPVRWWTPSYRSKRK